VINNSYTDKTSNVTYNSGPNPSEVAQHTGKPITAVPITASNKPGQQMSNNQLSLYRPQVQKAPADGTKPAPAKVADIKTVKTISQRNEEAKSTKASKGVKPLAPQQKATLQPMKLVPSQTQPNNQSAKQQPAQNKPNGQAAKQQPSQ
jgi:hypothetical protein